MCVVEELLIKVNEYKAVGPDNVHPFILKSLASVLSKPLDIIFNNSLNTGRLLGAWKEAIITPIHKKGDKTEVISFTSQVSKILKRTIRDEIVRHLERNDLITQYQHRFKNAFDTTSTEINF